MAEGQVEQAIEYRYANRWPALMDNTQAADYLSVSVRTLKEMSDPGVGIVKPVVLKGLIRYRKRDLDELIDELPSSNSPGQIRRRQAKTIAARNAKQQQAE